MRRQYISLSYAGKKRAHMIKKNNNNYKIFADVSYDKSKTCFLILINFEKIRLVSLTIQVGHFFFLSLYFVCYD